MTCLPPSPTNDTLRLEQRRPRARVDLAGDRQPVAGLEALDRAARDRAEDPVVVHADLRAGRRRPSRRRRRPTPARPTAARSPTATASPRRPPRRRHRRPRAAAASGDERRPRGHRRAHDHRRALPARRVFARGLGDLAPVHASGAASAPRARHRSGRGYRELPMGTTKREQTTLTPWGLAPTGLAVGLAQACATPPPTAAIRPIGLTMAVWVPRSPRPEARRLGCALFRRGRVHDAGADFCKPARTPARAGKSHSAGIVTLRPDDFAAASASEARSISSSAGSSPSQRATPAEAVWPRGVARAHAVEHLDRLAEPAARQDQPELDAVEPRQHVDLAQLAAPARAGLLDQAVALALAAQHVERAHVVEIDDRDRERRVRSGGPAPARAAAPPRTRAA